MGIQGIDRESIQEIVRSVLQQKSRSIGPSRVAVLEKPGELSIHRYPVPEISADEILVKVEGCGICGTDIHCFQKDPFGLAPVVLGHEGTGEVVAVGSAIRMDSVGKAVVPGDKIVTSTMDVSEACMIAKYNPAKANLCDDLQIYGLLPFEEHRPFSGYFADYLVIRPGSTFFVVNGMNLDLRLLIEPAAVVVHALERAKKTGLLNFRSRVVVQGCGPIGLMTIAVVRTFGVNNIIAVDGNPARLEMAKRLGADHALNFKNLDGTKGLIEAVNDLTKGMGAHFGFQVTGVPAAAASLWKLIRRGGGICEIGFFVDNGEYPVNPHFDICRKEITLVGSWAYNHWDYPNAYHFLQRAEAIGLPVHELITHRFPLERIEEAFRASIEQSGVKVVIEN